MSRTKTPTLTKAKDAIIACSDEEAETLYEWFDMLLEVREAEKERKLKALTV